MSDFHPWNYVSFNDNKTPNITAISGCNIGCRFCKYLTIKLICGKRGIRTPGALQLNGFQDRRNRPLCHLSGDKSSTVFPFCQIFTPIISGAAGAGLQIKDIIFDF